MEVLIFIILILTIIVSSGIISGSEAALLRVSYAKAKEISRVSKDNRVKKRAKRLVYIKENINRYISTIVILNNIVNIVGSIYVGIYASKLFGNAYLGIVSALLTFLIIIFSEIIPKLYGDKFSRQISLAIATPLIFIDKLFVPIVYLIDKITAIFVKDNPEESISEGEICEMATIGEKEGSINVYERNIISNVFKMDDLEVGDVMISKSKTVLIEYNSSLDEIVDVVQLSGFTRFPVVKNDTRVVGLINSKDLLRFYKRGEKFSLAKMLRETIHATPHTKLKDLELKLKKKKVHMAIVEDEMGDFLGIVTLEDIIEELLGEIEDEFDISKSVVKQNKNLSLTSRHLLRSKFDTK